MKNLERYRGETPGCKTKVHFNNAGASLMPTPVLDAIKNYLDLEAVTGGYETADLKTDEVNEFYLAAAKLINAKADQIAFTSSATNSFARALSCIPFEKGDSIVIANEDYVSNQIAFLSLEKRFGVKLFRAASKPEGGVDVDDMKTLIELHQPKLVSLTHIPTNTGLVQPVEAVGEMCKALDILYLVDACQSAGQWPIDVQKIHCDFLSVTMRKFLRGPRGAGFLFVSDKVLDRGMEPLFLDMRGATWTSADEYVLHSRGRRFEDWEIPYPLVLGSKAAIEYALEVGIENIRQRNTQLCDFIRKQLSKINGVKILDIGTPQSSIITIILPVAEPEKLVQTLRNKNINTSMATRGSAVIDFDNKHAEWALRISPHYYNTEEECDLLMRELVVLSS